MRGGTTPLQERSSGTTPASVTAAGSSATPGQPVPAGPLLRGRVRTLNSTDRSVDMKCCSQLDPEDPADALSPVVCH